MLTNFPPSVLSASRIYFFQPSESDSLRKESTNFEGNISFCTTLFLESVIRITVNNQIIPQGDN